MNPIHHLITGILQHHADTLLLAPTALPLVILYLCLLILMVVMLVAVVLVDGCGVAGRTQLARVALMKNTILR